MPDYKKSISDSFKPSYDSDEDLDEKTQSKIKNALTNSDANYIRNRAWDNADAFSKIKRAVKGAWNGDVRKKED